MKIDWRISINKSLFSFNFLLYLMMLLNFLFSNSIYSLWRFDIIINTIKWTYLSSFFFLLSFCIMFSHRNNDLTHISFFNSMKKRKDCTDVWRGHKKSVYEINHIRSLKHIKDNFYLNWTSWELFCLIKINHMEEFKYKKKEIIEKMDYKIINELLVNNLIYKGFVRIYFSSMRNIIEIEIEQLVSFICLLLFGKC